jgi:hypothetical protein
MPRTKRKPKRISILNMLSMLIQGNSSSLVFNHKELIKSGISSQASKPKKLGRDKPAKGYDQENHKWI